MNVTAVAVEDLENKGLGLLPNKTELTVCGNAFPDTNGECIGRYDEDTGEYESFFKKDKDEGNTRLFDQYREKCNLYKRRRTLFVTDNYTEKHVIEYYVMYNIQESSKNRPTEIDDHVSHSICINGNYKCEYELLFAEEGMSRRIVAEYKSNNVPMYEFVNDLEYLVEEALEGDADESNPFFNVFSACEDCEGCHYFEVTMFDKVGMNYNIGFEKAADFMAMLVSVRLLSCEFIEDK